MVLIVARYPPYLHGFFLSLNALLIGTHFTSSCNVSRCQSGLLFVGGSHGGGFKGSMGSMGSSTMSLPNSNMKGPFKISISSLIFSRGGGRGRSLSFLSEASSSKFRCL